MKTVSKNLAEQIIRELKKQKRPRVYCVFRYWSSKDWSSKNWQNKGGYAFCYNHEEFEKVINSYYIEILWSSRRHRKDVEEWHASVKN